MMRHLTTAAVALLIFAPAVDGQTPFRFPEGRCGKGCINLVAGQIEGHVVTPFERPSPNRPIIVNDTFVFDFGTSNHQASAYLATGGTATTARYFSMPPIVIGPQEHFLAHYWGTSLTAATFENLIGWVEV